MKKWVVAIVIKNAERVSVAVYETTEFPQVTENVVYIHIPDSDIPLEYAIRSIVTIQVVPCENS